MKVGRTVWGDGGSRRVAVAIAAALTALAVIAGGAQAATSGKLRFAQCFEGWDLEGEKCADAPGLDGANSVAVSADGKSVYAASEPGYALGAPGGPVYYGGIVRFDRDPITGALGFAECFEDENSDSEGAKCANAPSLGSASSVAVSADGRSVYAASSAYGVARFDRDPITGALGFAGCIEDEDRDLEGAKCANAPGLYGATSVAVSADGRSVYAASFRDHTIVRFNRDPTTGEIGFAGCFEDDDENSEREKCANAPGLRGSGFDAGSVAVSADGRSVYAASFRDNAIVRFNRKKTTGALGFAGCFEDGDKNREGRKCDNASGLEGAASVAVSADGRSLYAGSLRDNAIVRFDRKRRTGALRFARCIEDEDLGSEREKCANAPGLGGGDSADSGSVAVSADGRSLYAALHWDSAIVRFDRKRKTGALRFAGCIEDEDANSERAKCANAPGLGGATSVAVSADGRSLYAGSREDNAIVRFDRVTRPPRRSP